MLRYIVRRSIEQLSRQGMRYTERQLYYVCCRALLPPFPLSSLLPAVPVAALLARAQRSATGWLAGAALAGGVGWALAQRPATRRVPLTWQQFHTALAAYRAAHGDPPGLLPPALHLPHAEYVGEPDLHDYGLERVLICQHNELATMLLSNGLHLEIRCAILGPCTDLPAPIAAMVGRTPGAQVSLLHDASHAGATFVALLRERLHLPATAHLVDIGLRPLHARRLHLVATHAAHHAGDTHAAIPADTLARAVETHYTATEQRWLRRGLTAEVAALPPDALLLKLRRILTGSPRPRRWWQRLAVQHDREIGFMTWPAP